MRIKDSYDLIIVGEQLAAYLLACGVAKAGKKVLLIEEESNQSTYYDFQTGSFLIDLKWEPIIGLVEGGREDLFLQEIGLYESMESLFPRFSPRLQIISEDLRVDCEFSRLQEEWRREAPAQADRLSAFQDYVLSQKKIEQRKFASVVEDFELDTKWEKLGDLYAALFGSYIPSSASLSFYQDFYQHADASVRYYLGGMDRLRKLLLARLDWFGGQVKSGAKVERIVFKGGKAKGVFLDSFEAFIPAKMVVGAMCSRSFSRLIPKKYRTSSLQAGIDSMQAKYWRFPFTIKIPLEAVPEGMAEHICFHNFQSDLEDGHFFQIQALEEENYPGVNPQEKVLLVRMLLPYQEKSLQLKYIDLSMRRVMDYLSSFIPFLSESNFQVIPNPAQLAVDPVFQELLHFKNLSEIPNEFLVYGEVADSKSSCALTQDWSKYGIDGLGLCSRDIYPAMGSIGEVKASIELVQKLTN